MNNTLQTNRTHINKLTELSIPKFVQFIKYFFPLNKTKFNSNISIFEKIDGSSIKLLITQDDVLYESSYGGIKQAENTPFSACAVFIDNQFKSKLISIVKANRLSGIKIVGELLWSGDFTKQSITPVCATYNTDKLGGIGSIILLDILKVENNSLVNLTEQEFTKINNDIVNISTNLFSFIPIKEN